MEVRPTVTPLGPLVWRNHAMVSGSPSGRGRTTNGLAMLNSRVLAPIASAIVTTATTL